MDLWRARFFLHLRSSSSSASFLLRGHTSMCSGLMRASCALNKLFMITNSVRPELLPCSAIHRSAVIRTNVVFYPNDLMMLRMPRTPCDRWISVHFFPSFAFCFCLALRPSSFNGAHGSECLCALTLAFNGSLWTNRFSILTKKEKYVWERVCQLWIAVDSIAWASSYCVNTKHTLTSQGVFFLQPETKAQLNKKRSLRRGSH